MFFAAEMHVVTDAFPWFDYEWVNGAGRRAKVERGQNAGGSNGWPGSLGWIRNSYRFERGFVPSLTILT